MATRTRPAQTPYTWDPAAGRYRLPSGNLVAAAALTQELERIIARQAVELRTLTTRYQTGQITLTDWHLTMRAAVKDLHLYSAALARGGWDQMDSAAFGQVGGRMRLHYAYLDRLAGELDSGLPIRGNLQTRAASYAQAARGTYARAQRSDAIVAGRTCRNILHPLAEHCAECEDLSALSWIPADEMPPIGARECGPGCRCRLDFQGGTGPAVRADPPARSGPVAERRGERRSALSFQVGDRVRGKVTVGTVVAREPDGRYVVRTDAGKTTRIRPTALRPAEPTDPARPPTAVTPPDAVTPAPLPPSPAPVTPIRVGLGSWVTSRDGRVSGTVLAREGELLRVLVPPRAGTLELPKVVLLKPAELVAGVDPRLATVRLPDPAAPPPASLEEAATRIRVATGGATALASGLGLENGRAFGQRIASEGTRLLLARDLTLQLERLKRQFPGLGRIQHVLLVDAKRGRARLPVTETGTGYRPTWFSTSYDLGPSAAMVARDWETMQGVRYGVGAITERRNATTRHEVAHTQSTARSIEAWRIARAQIERRTGVRFDFRKAVSDYASGDEEWEEIAETAALATAPDYVPGTLPPELESFVVRLYNGEYF